MSVNKQTLIGQIAVVLSEELAGVQAAAAATASAATHEESKAENQYDTRGLEASYLAGAQQERVAELEAAIVRLKNTPPRSFTSDDRIALTALAELDHDGTKLWYLVMAVGAGITLQDSGRSITVITPQSPLGRALLGKRCGDDVTLSTPQGERHYDIVAIS